MLHRHTLGRVPPKPHIQFRDADGRLLMEQCVTRAGFDGPYSILYFRVPPTDEFEVGPLELPGFCPCELIRRQPLRRRHIRSQQLEPGGDFLTARKTLLANADLHLAAGKPAAPAGRLFSKGDGFAVCSFVPRLVDFHERAIPCPDGHASADMDEILYYVEGNFTSRRGIEPGSISLHPQGVPHGPHPGAYENSIGARHSGELAVMCDTRRPLRLTTTAAALEDRHYHASWVDPRGRSSWNNR